MKKRILSLLLVVCMVVGMLPASVFAADETLTPALFRLRAATEGYTQTATNVWNTNNTLYASIKLQPGDGPLYYKTDASGYLIDGTAEDYNVKFSYEGKAAQIFLKGANIVNEYTNGTALYLGDHAGIDDTVNHANYEIIVEEESVIKQTSGTSGVAVLNSTRGTLTVKSVAGAKLTVNGKTTAGDMGVFVSAGPLVLKDAKLHVAPEIPEGSSSTNKGTTTCPLYVQSDITIDGADVTLFSSSNGIYATGKLTVENGARLTAYTANNNPTNGVEGQITLRNSIVKLGTSSDKGVLNADTKVEYDMDYTALTGTVGNKNVAYYSAGMGFAINGTGVEAFDPALTSTYKYVELVPVKEPGYVKFAQGDTATTYHSVTITQGDARYFVKVDTDEDGVVDTFTEEGASAANYNIKIAYPVAGDVMVYLRGAQLVNTAQNSSALFLGTNDDIDPGVETAAGNKANYEIIVEENSSVKQSNGTSGRAIFGSTTGTVTITSVNDALLTAEAATTNGSFGVVTTAGDLVMKDANVYVGQPAGQKAKNSYGVYSKYGDVRINNSAFNVYTRSKSGIYAAGDVVIENGSRAKIYVTSADTYAVNAGGEIYLLESSVKVGTSDGAGVFNKAPKEITYADAYTVVTSSGVSSGISYDGKQVNFTVNATNSTTYDPASVATYKYIELKPDKAVGSIKIPTAADGTLTTVYMDVGSATRYFTVVDGYAVEDGTGKNYNIKIEYPVNGVLTMTLNGAHITTYGIEIANSAKCPVKIVTVADSSIIATNGTGTGGTPLYNAASDGTVTFTSQNDATLTVTGKRTGVNNGYIEMLGDIIFDNANVKVVALTGSSSGTASGISTKGDVTIKGGNYTHLRDSNAKHSAGGAIKADEITFEDANVKVISYSNGTIFTATTAITLKNTAFEAGVIYNSDVGLFSISPDLDYEPCSVSTATKDMAVYNGDLSFKDMTNPVTFKEGDENATTYRHVKIVPADAHAYGDWEITKPADCTTDGEKQSVCANCGDIKTEVIPAAHASSDAWTSDATHHWKDCTGCGKEKFEYDEHNEGPALKEDVVPATETADGSYKLVTRCLTCNAVMSSVDKTIPMIRRAGIIIDGTELTVLNDGNGLYYWTVDGALTTTKVVGEETVEADTNNYNVKFIYNPEDTVAKLYLKDAVLTAASTKALLSIGRATGAPPAKDFSAEIILEGTSTLTKTATTDYIVTALNAGHTVKITGNGTLNLHTKKNNGSEGAIHSGNQITIDKEAKINIYHSATYANTIVMNDGAGLVIDGTLNIYNSSDYEYDEAYPTRKSSTITTNGGGNVYINKGANVTIVSRQRSYIFDVSGEIRVNSAMLSIATGGDGENTGYLFKNKAPIMTGVNPYVSLDGANVSDKSEATELSVYNIPATELYNEENWALYKYAAIVPHDHVAKVEWESNETYHWHNCDGVCDENLTHEKAEHVKGEPQKENIKEATTTATGSYDLVTRCTVCDYKMKTETVVTPMIKAAYVWIFYGDDANKVSVKVTDNGVARYLKTTEDGKILKDNGNVVEGSENDYNIKLVYENGAAAAELTLQNAKLVGNGLRNAIQLGYQTNTTNFSVNIVLKGTNSITDTGDANFYCAIGSELDADQKVTISGNGVLNAFTNTSSGYNGVITAPDLTIEAGATVNAYNIGDGYPICVSVTAGDLTVNGKLGAYTLNGNTYENTIPSGIIYNPTLKVAGNININKGAVVTIRSRQRSYAFDAGGKVYINEATVDALVGALSGATTPATTYVFKKAPVLSGALDAQGTDSLSIQLNDNYEIVEVPALQRFDQFDANVLTYRYVKIVPHEHVYETKVSDQKADDATCEHGVKYYVQCRNCDKVSDTVTVETTKPLAHTWADPTCTTGKVCSFCKKAFTYGVDPYYLVNLASMGGSNSDTYSNAYQMPQFWTDENNVVAFNKKTDVVEIAKDLKAVFDTYPVGTRYINFTMVGAAFANTYEYGIYMHNGVKLVKEWLNEFLLAYKAIGGQLDGISTDLEFEWGRGYDLYDIYEGSHHKLDQNVNIYKDIYNAEDDDGNRLFETSGLKQMLDERGFTYAEGDDPLFGIHDKTSKEYQIYNQAFNILMNDYIDEAMEPLFNYYSDAKLFDYDRGYSEAWQGVQGGYSTMGQGTADRVGNSSNKSLYMTSPSYVIFNHEDGGPYVYNKGKFEKNAFNAAKWNVEEFKQMLASTPVEEDGKKNVSVWIAGYEYYQNEKNGNVRPAHTNNSPYYAEAILHIGLANPSPFIGYVKPPVIGKDEAGEDIHDVATYNKYLDTVNDLMVELTLVAGTDDRRPIELPYSWNDSYILSGMEAGGRNIWRITPENGLDGFLVMSENGTPTFRAGGQTIIFPQGRIVETDNEISNVGTCGYWVETPVGVNPVVVSDENRYSEANGFTGAANNAELFVYDKYGFIIDATVANEGFTAYYVNWMNVDNTYKYLIIRNNGEKIREELMAPGQDGFFVGEIESGNNLLTVETVDATGYEAEDPYASDDFYWADATEPNHDYKYVSIDENNHKYVCDCGEEGAVAIESEPHEFADDNDATCDKCGYERELGPIYDSRLTNSSVALAMESGIVAQFIMTDPILNYGYDSVWIVVERNGKTFERFEVTEYQSSGDRIAFFVDFPAALMTAKTTVNFYAEKDGKTYIGEPLTNWTVRAKAFEMLNTNYKETGMTDKQRNTCYLVANMLNYGKAAQIRFGVLENDYATVGLDPKFAAMIKTEAPTVNGWTQPKDPEGAIFIAKKFSLGLQANVQLQVRFSVADTTNLGQYYAKIVNITDGNKETIIPGTEFQIANGYVYVLYDGLAAAQLRDTISITIYQGETPVSGTFELSVENVAATMSGYTDLVAAMMNYSDYAKIRFSK